MDNLTNWYIRRSRKRFWKSENDSDKSQAYETLYYILVELTKIIAPFMPFVSEYIFKELTGKKSVHLEDFPLYNPKLIDEKLNADTDKVQKIITLGLAWRANNKIRVRQPLNSITITEKLENYYEEIIKEELNVKEILVVSGDKLAKKICKPNGRNIGPKFGKDVKFIMEEAKA
jgi:isoleucyl-tRNA synthetase